MEELAVSCRTRCVTRSQHGLELLEPVPEKSLGVAALTHDSLLTSTSYIRNLTSNEGRIGIVTFVEPKCIALRVCGLMRFVGFMRDKAAGAAPRSPVGASWAVHIVV